MAEFIKNFSDGEVSIWFEENGGVFIKCHEPYNDPVELSEDEAEEVARWLMDIVERLRS